MITLQGEDVVAGIRTPEDIDAMRVALPDAYNELLENCEILEKHYKDMMVSNLFCISFHGQKFTALCRKFCKTVGPKIASWFELLS